jgi:Transglutaminase-like superfamily
MPSLRDYARQSPYSDPGEHAALLTALPVNASAATAPDVNAPDQAGVPAMAGLAAVARNVLVHYRASGIPFPPERLAEIDSRWVERLLAVDRSRFDTPLDAPRPEPDRVAACCRDFTLLTVSALRAHGVPARSRVGFAAYFVPGWHHDHVITEYWDGERWVCADSQLDPDWSWPFDPLDLPLGEGVFEPASRVWTAYRRGDIDVDQYGVDIGLPIRGNWFVRNYVLMELAHRQRDELLLWDTWGVMSDRLDGDLGLIDDVASLLIAADGGDDGAEQQLAERYADDPRLHPGDRVRCLSPTGVTREVDLRTRSRA